MMAPGLVGIQWPGLQIITLLDFPLSEISAPCSSVCGRQEGMRPRMAEAQEQPIRRSQLDGPSTSSGLSSNKGMLRSHCSLKSHR